MYEFYGALYEPVICYLETLNAFIVLKRRSLDIVSVSSGEVIGRINPELAQNATVREKFGYFRPSPNETSLSALYREGEHSWAVSWDLTSASLKYKAKLCLEKTGKFLNCEIDETSHTIHILQGSKAEINFCNLKIEGDSSTNLATKTLEVPCSFCLEKKVICKRIYKDVFVLASRRHVLVANFRKNLVSTKLFHSKDHFETIAVSEKGKVAAIGCQTGRIYVIKQILSSSEAWIISVCHWHSDFVKALSFNKEETILLSGGNENVLVTWPLDDLQRKNFIPRLPSRISHIHTKSGSDRILCILEDNSFVVVSYSGKIRSHFQLFVKDPCVSVGINNSPSNVKSFGNTLIANSHPGMLQFVSVPTGKVTMELDVSGFNYVSSKEKLTEWKISTFDINANGFLCSLEQCSAKEVNTTVLKFWKFESEKFTQMQSVTGVKLTSIDPQIISRPKYNDFVVLSDSFSIWRLGEENFETMLLVSKHDPLPRHLTFSLDGSVMIACFHNLLQLWTGSHNLETRNYLPTTKKCSSAVFGKNALIATYFLVTFEDSFEIRDVARKEPRFESGESLENVFAVETYPAFVGFCSSKCSVIVISGHLSDIFDGYNFVSQLFECTTNVTKGVPFMLHDDCVDLKNDSVSKEEIKNHKWLKDHSLVYITKDSRFYALSSPLLKEPFSLLQMSDFLDLAKLNEGTMKKDRYLGSSISDKLGQASLNKFISHELKSFSSHLLPKIDSMLEQILAHTTVAADVEIGLKKDLESDQDSGFAVEESDNEKADVSSKTAVSSSERTTGSSDSTDSVCRIELMTTVVVPDFYDV